MRHRPPLADILMQRATGLPIVIAPASKPAEPTLIVRKPRTPPPPPPTRVAPRTFGAMKPEVHVTSWVLALLLVIGAGLRPIDPMKTWRSAANELQLTESARELIRELR